jgi:hypothetical protein
MITVPEFQPGDQPMTAPNIVTQMAEALARRANGLELAAAAMAAGAKTTYEKLEGQAEMPLDTPATSGGLGEAPRCNGGKAVG